MAGPDRATAERVGQKPAGGAPRPQEELPAPALSEAILALQRGAGNRAVARLLAGRSGGRRLQRMQLVATDPGNVESDPVVLMNIRHGRAVNAAKGVDSGKERIASLGDDYSGDDIDFDHKEVVFLHGHGSTGLYAGMFALKAGDQPEQVTYDEAADVVATRLRLVTKEEKKNKPYEIRILTCKGGDPRSPYKAPSLVQALQAKLADAPNLIKIKGFVQSAFSYEGWKTHSEPDAFNDPWKKHLEAPFDAFKEWLKTDEGKGAKYPERLNKIGELVPLTVVDAFMQDLRTEGAYAKQARRGDAPDTLTEDQSKTLIKVFNRST